MTENATNPRPGEGADGSGPRTADKSAQSVVAAFGQTVKTLRLRAGMDREELGRRLGYPAATIASFEQGRRIPPPRAIFTVVTRKDGKRFLYVKAQATSKLETDPEQAATDSA